MASTSTPSSIIYACPATPNVSYVSPHPLIAPNAPWDITTSNPTTNARLYAPRATSTTPHPPPTTIGALYAWMAVSPATGQDWSTAKPAKTSPSTALQPHTSSKPH
jgi:hypothetical protein